jgi:hypothetical protein
MTQPPKQPLPLRILLAVAKGVLAGLVLLDEAARPLYRPLSRWIARLRIVARMEEAVARLPRLAILIVLAVPFVVAEPLKLVGLLLMARGRVVAGLVILALAYLASFLLVERIYHAGRDKLLTYRWLAWLMGMIVSIRERLLAWVRASAAYAFARRVRDDAREWWRESFRKDRS